MVFGFIGSIIDMNRGLKNVMGSKFKVSRERAYARRLRRLEVPEHKIKKHLEEAETKGNIKQIEKEMHKLVKIQHRKGKIIFQLMEGEDIVEFDAITKLGDAKARVKGIKKEFQGDILQRLEVILKSFKKLAELQFGKMSYLMEGGKPWEGITNVASWDMGTTENVVLGEAWKQRGMIKDMRKGLEMIEENADKISIELRAETPRVDKITKFKEKMTYSLKKVESADQKLSGSLKLQFYCTLRMIDFLEQDIKEDKTTVHHYKEEGFPEEHAQKMINDIKAELERVKKGESKEQGRLMLEVNEAARKAA